MNLNKENSKSPFDYDLSTVLSGCSVNCMIEIDENIICYSLKHHREVILLDL
jgi:hypothetical protein